jgi:hypothetical protein
MIRAVFGSTGESLVVGICIWQVFLVLAIGGLVLFGGGWKHLRDTGTLLQRPTDEDTER